MASRREKLIDNARPYLDEGEEVRFIVSGQTGAPQGPIGAMAIVIGKAKQRRIVATDAHLYVLEGDFWGTSKSKGLVAKHRLDEVQLSYTGRVFKVNGETIWLHPFAEGDANSLAELGAKDEVVA